MTFTSRFKRSISQSLITLFWGCMVLLGLTLGLVTLLSLQTKFARVPESPPAQKK